MHLETPTQVEGPSVVSTHSITQLALIPLTGRALGGSIPDRAVLSVRAFRRETDAPGGGGMPQHGASEFFDVIVIGGGPAGSTVSSLIAMQGHRVLLLEREEFPRHQIGESLLPATVHGICGLLGLGAQLEAAGFPRKRGGTFLWGKNPVPWTFSFSKNTDAPGGYAYQVERAKFDKILLDCARQKGVDVRERHCAQKILLESGRAVGVHFTDDRKVDCTAHARFVVDAGGFRSQQHNRCVGERVYSKFFQNVALYAYFENGKRLPPPNEGNIFCAAFPQGWFWYIPLSSTLTSVGAVVAREAAHLIKNDAGTAFAQFVEACPQIADYLSGATRVREGMYGEYRVKRDYSYCNTKFSAPGLVLVGDSACFVDPVFSSGVHLATYAGLLAARSINTALRGTIDEEACFIEYERRYRREFGKFYQFLIAFYDVHQDEESYFWTARKILGTEERSNDAFVRLVAGLSAEDESLFSSSQFFDARVGLGEWLELAVSRPGGRSRTSNPQLNGAKFDPDRFMQGLKDEIVQVQLQALYGEKRPAERSIWKGGLIPSLDGLHWQLESSH